MAKPNGYVVPPGGWHYYEGDVRLEARSLPALYDSVMMCRTGNSRPLGDYIGDVDTYLCGQFPELCVGYSPSNPTTSQPAPTAIEVSAYSPTQIQELINDVTVWARNLLDSGTVTHLVGDELAEERAKICIKCPQSQVFSSGCGSCITTANRLSASVRQARHTATSRIIGACKILRHDNQTAIFMEKHNLAKSGDLPEHCWLNE